MLIFVAACANPMPPTGGPTDETPPFVRVAVPEDQSVEVQALSLTLEFSEYIDQATFARALSITPAFSEAPDISWRGRTATVRFPETLRTNTTYIVQIGTELRDAHGVALRDPISLAFATGSRIDRGRISGMVLEPERGEPVAGIDVFAYGGVRPNDLRILPDAPDYRTQTGSDGRFTFLYLSEANSYYVVALADANRNRAAEPTEAFAVPWDPIVRADTIAQADTSLARWVTTQIDTIAPEPQRVRPISSRRFAVRFSEPVRLTGSVRWTVRDTTGAREYDALPYVTGDDRRELFALTDSLPAGSYRVVPSAVVDSAGNAAESSPVEFEVTPLADTTSLRFVEFEPDSVGNGTLRPGEWPELVFSTAVQEARVRELVTVTDSAGERVAFDLETTSHTHWSVRSPTFERGDPVVITVVEPGAPSDTSYVHRFTPLAPEETGEVSGVVRPEGYPVVVELYGGLDGEPRRARTGSNGRFVVGGLPEGQYFIRAYADRDSSESWSGGLLAPYEPPEEIAWLADSVRVRARWEAALEDTLWLSPNTPSVP